MPNSTRLTLSSYFRPDGNAPGGLFLPKLGKYESLEYILVDFEYMYFKKICCTFGYSRFFYIFRKAFHKIYSLRDT